uniref:Vezatin n=1 Tax=Petromyzon marinus TaxID=7757 RepID=S4RIT0_PETMA
PLDAEADNVTNYLCAVPLAELGLGMELHCGATVGVGAELRDETAILDRAAELTDGFSLQALKVLYQLWVGQSSEFLRRLVLALYAAPRGHEQDCNRSTLPSRTLSDPSPCVSSATPAAVPYLSTAPPLPPSRPTQPPLDPGARVRLGRVPARLRQSPPLHAAVRSLQLHLKMALQELPIYDIVILDYYGKALLCTRDSEAETAAAAEAAAELLSSLGPRMEAARACWDETVTRSRALRRRGDRDGAADCGCLAEPPRSVGEDRPALVIIDDRDPIPEEQEFESFAGDPEDGPPPPGSGDPRGERRSPDPEERERLRRRLEEARREREEARRLLDELKSVLGVRTSLEQRAVWRSALF